jgi:hypothetical protein
MRRIFNFSVIAITAVTLSGAAYAQSTSQFKYKNQIKAKVGTNAVQLRTNWVDVDGDGICDNYSSAARLRNMKANGGKGMGLRNGSKSFGNGSGYRFGDGSGLHPQDGTGLGFKHGVGTGTGTGIGVCDGTGPKGNAKGRK